MSDKPPSVSAAQCNGVLVTPSMSRKKNKEISMISIEQKRRKIRASAKRFSGFLMARFSEFKDGYRCRWSCGWPNVARFEADIDSGQDDYVLAFSWFRKRLPSEISYIVLPAEASAKIPVCR
jgi:hypothetical protein